ncbi:MAG: tRNA(His) guanylyltransferase Thg1 family protein [Erysipelotrichaceae bacterium]|nr:tRNA(His) guanylyltransferase Thg1 family protein [Erysipelotrichaceae bacterium]
MVKDALGDRMKKYEYVSRIYLTPRTPVIIRLDGKAFHTFTRGFKKPFDMVLVKTMQETMKFLCENIQGCVLGYTQSDEITLVLVDYKKINSCAWFDYNIQKCASVAVSMATMAFNKFFEKNVNDWISKNTPTFHEAWSNLEDEKLYHTYLKAFDKGAMFDARVFNIPKEEVTNCILWRQNDATRNSIEMVGHANFSQNQLHKKSCNEIQDMLMLQRGINWNDFPTTLKRGSCCKRIVVSEPDEAEFKTRSRWVIDNEIPIFKGDNRAYIDELIFIGESV